MDKAEKLKRAEEGLQRTLVESGELGRRWEEAVRLNQVDRKAALTRASKRNAEDISYWCQQIDAAS